MSDTNANNEFTVYLSDDDAEGVLQYQKAHGLTKSKAGGRLIRAGLRQWQSGIGANLFWEFAKMSLVLTVAFAGVWHQTGDQTYIAYSYTFLGAAFGSLLIDYKVGIKSVFSRFAPSKTTK